ncbi:hypothetical protein MBLNU230_g2639t1 [Neophaeotheca triangularis]
MSGYAKMKNAELEAMCKERGLTHTGKKADLVKRLDDYDAAGKTPAASAPVTTTAANVVDDEIDWDADDDLEAAKAATSEPAAATIAAGGTGQVANPRAVPNQVAGEHVTGAETIGAPAPVADAPDAAEVEEKVTAKQQTAEEKAAQDAKKEAEYTSGIQKNTVDMEIEAIEKRATKFGMTEEAKVRLEALQRVKKFGGEGDLGGINGALNDVREKKGRRGDRVQSGRVEKKGRPDAGGRNNSGRGNVAKAASTKTPYQLSAEDQAAAEKRRARWGPKPST